MREHPWHLRRVSTAHAQWFRDLTDLHALTLAWLREAGQPLTQFIPATGADDLDLEECLPRLDPGRPLEEMLDDTLPDDVLGRLERTVWALQAWVAKGLIETLSREKLGAVAQEAGRACALSRWPSLDDSARGDLRGVLAAFRDSPLVGHGGRESLLITRAVARELHLELHLCPHMTAFPEPRACADLLCALHMDWIQGFVRALNDRIHIENRVELPHRCQQRWTLPAPPANF
jgi:hypothetical protein